MPVAAPPLDLRAVRRCRARHHRRGLLLHPAERRDVLVRSQQDPRLAGTGLRGEIGLPLGQAVRALGQPAGHVRGVAVAHRPAQHGQREPVDLEVHDPGDVGGGDDALPARDPLRDANRGHVVRAEQHGQHDAHGGDHERGEQRPAEVVDGEHPVGHVQVGGDEEDEGVRDQHEQEAEHERERQAQSGEHRWDDRVQRRDDRRDEQRTPEALDVDARKHRGGHHQRDARGEPRDEEREQPQARTLGPPGRGLAVVGLGAAGRHVLLLRSLMIARGLASWWRGQASPGLGALRSLLRLLLGVLGLLLGDLDLRVRVRLRDELLATRPAEDPDDEHERDDGVPGGRDQLLRRGVVDRRLPRDVAAGVERQRVGRLRDPDCAGRERDDVGERARPRHPHDRLERDRDREGRQEDPDHGELAEPGEERRQERVRQVLLRAREDHAALLRLDPELLQLPPEDAAEDHDQRRRRPPRSGSSVTGSSETLPRLSSNEPGTDRNR